MRKTSQHEKDNSPEKSSPSKRVVYLIGLPGVGKTTVGEIIAKKTGFVLFDHNITYKEVCRFLKKGTCKAHTLNGKLHLAILNLLLHSKIEGVICTMSIRCKPTSKTVLRAVKLAEKMGSKVSFIKLKCEWKEHTRRVQMPSRKGLNKTNTIQKLKKYMTMPCFEGLKEYPPWIIDNTEIPANKCAEKIISTLKLKK